MPITIYKSSAGSGKTYTLVKEYLTLLLKRPSEFRNILAITFTNKATGEMKERIIKELAALSREENPQLAEQILEAFLAEKEWVNEEVKEREKERIRNNSRYALHNILHNYSDFSVSTIDSFFQKVMRFFIQELKAKRVKIPMRYEVEMDTGFVLEQITSQLMLEIGEQERKALTNWMESFTYAQMEEDKGWRIEQGIRDLGQEIFKEKYYEISKESGGEPELEQLKGIIQELWKIRRMFEGKMQEYGAEALEMMQAFGVEIGDFRRGTAVYFQQIQKGKYELKKTLEKIVAGDETLWYAKKAAKKEKIIQALNSGLHDIFVESVRYKNDYYPLYIAAIEVLKNIYTYGILARLKDKLKDYRTENNLMLISDTNNILNEIVSKEDMPFIFEKVGTVFRHILIDEFQDTSNFQWRNLLPLIINSLGEDFAVLVVGDVKQSIYRWRGGNMNLLLDGVKEELANLTDHFKEADLKNNWRSREFIVRFNNSFFQTAAAILIREFTDFMPQDLIRKAYQTVKQEVQHEGGGHVQVRFLNKDDWHNLALEQLLTLIRELQEEGFHLKDMAILTRRNTEGSEIAMFLAEHNIKVVSSDSLLLKNSLKVLLLLQILKYLADKRDKIAKTAILVQYLALYPEIAVEKLGREPEVHEVFADHLIDLEEQENNLFNQILPKAFVDHMDSLSKKPLYEMVELLVLYLNLKEEADAYVQRFQDLILEHSIAKSTDVRNFLAWWEENQDSDKTSIIVPKGEEAITIMTVHKAKGLEFEIVLMPFCEWNFVPKSGSILWSASTMAPFDELGAVPLRVSKNLGESIFGPTYFYEYLQSFVDNLNLLYVAFTRPTERLYIFTPEIPKKASPSMVASDKVCKLLYATLTNAEFEFYDSWQGEENQFVLGANEPKTTEVVEETKDVDSLHVYLCEDYQDRISIRSDARKYIEVYDKKQPEARRLGIQVHAVLEKLRHPQELESVIRKLQSSGIIFRQEEAEIKKRIEKIFELSLVQHWFSDHWDAVITEQAILMDTEQKIPDRVMIKGNEATVLDFKTGQAQKKYTKQLKDYAGALVRMGYTVKDMYLLYVREEAEIERVV